MNRLCVTAWLSLALVGATPAIAEPMKVCVPQRGIWETAPPDLGTQAGIFSKHGLELDITYTQGAGETLQAVISGSCDVGLSVGTLGVLGAYAKGAPIRIIAANSTGFAETYFYVPANSPIKSLKDAEGKTIAYSTSGSSTQIAAMALLDLYGVKGKPVAAGAVGATYTQVRSGQIDIGWATPPFQLDELRRGEIRMIARASDVPDLRKETVRVQIANAATVSNRAEMIARYMQAYRETLDWMYASPDAIKLYIAFAGFSEESVRQMMAEFIPRADLQTDEIRGMAESMNDAIRFKFLTAPLAEAQLSGLMAIPKAR